MSGERAQEDDPERPQKNLEPEEAFRICEALLAEPLPDYDDSSSDDDAEADRRVVEQLRQLGRTGHKLAGADREGTTLGRSTRILNRTTNLPATITQPLARSMKTIQDGLTATVGRSIRAEDREQQMTNAQNLYRWQKDRAVAKRPLPPITRRMNYGPGRQNLKLGNTTQRERNLIEDPEDLRQINLQPIPANEERIYDTIGKQGTIGRQLGKKLRLYRQAKSVRFDTDHSSPSTSGQNHAPSRRSVSDDMY